MRSLATRPALTPLPEPVEPLSGGGGSSVAVIIQMNNFPSEVAWEITDQVGATVVSIPFGSYPDSQSTVRRTVPLQGDATYTFAIRDSFGDGLCCPHPGNYIVVLGTTGNGAVLVSGGGNYGQYPLPMCP